MSRTSPSSPNTSPTFKPAISVDVSYVDKDGKVQSNYATRPYDDQGSVVKLKNPTVINWHEDDDFDVLEDY